MELLTLTASPSPVKPWCCRGAGLGHGPCSRPFLWWSERMTQSCDEECKMKFRNPPMLDERLMGSLGFLSNFLGILDTINKTQQKPAIWPRSAVERGRKSPSSIDPMARCSADPTEETWGISATTSFPIPADDPAPWSRWWRAPWPGGPDPISPFGGKEEICMEK